MQDIVEGAIWHPVCDDDGVGGRRRLTCSQHRQHIWVGKYPGMEGWWKDSQGDTQEKWETHNSNEMRQTQHIKVVSMQHRHTKDRRVTKVRIKQKPEFGVLLVEVSALPRCPVADFQHFNNDFVPLPAPLPKLPVGNARREKWGDAALQSKTLSRITDVPPQTGFHLSWQEERAVCSQSQRACSKYRFLEN